MPRELALLAGRVARAQFDPLAGADHLRVPRQPLNDMTASGAALREDQESARAAAGHGVPRFAERHQTIQEIGALGLRSHRARSVVRSRPIRAR